LGKKFLEIEKGKRKLEKISTLQDGAHQTRLFNGEREKKKSLFIIKK